MATIYLPNNAGDVFYDASAAECYHKATTNPVCHAADTTLASGDVTGVAAVTHSLDDLGVFEGTTHRTWTACQMCVALHVSGNQGEVECPDSATKYELFTAPADGVLRIWATTTSGSVYNTSSSKIYVNDVAVFTGQIDGGYYYRPVVLAAGDVVDVELAYPWSDGSYQTAYAIFCPYVYP